MREDHQKDQIHREKQKERRIRNHHGSLIELKELTRMRKKSQGKEKDQNHQRFRGKNLQRVQRKKDNVAKTVQRKLEVQVQGLVENAESHVNWKEDIEANAYADHANM